MDLSFGYELEIKFGICDGIAVLIWLRDLLSSLIHEQNKKS